MNIRIRRRVRSFIIENNLISNGDLILAGLSGGADSVFLLSTLHWLSSELGFTLYAMHVHHGIRGAEADRDLRFSREFSASLGIRFIEAFVDTPSYASSRHIGTEEAARILRYEALIKEKNRLSDENGCRCLIAVAHHMEDQAETFLHNLFRGSGLPGLSGMERKREDVIRPLLFISKKEILEDLKYHSLPYVVDSSNSDISYTRNRIRLTILPKAEDINEEAVAHIVNTCSFIKEADELIRNLAVDFIKKQKITVVLQDSKESKDNGDGDEFELGLRLGLKAETQIDVLPLRALSPILRRYVYIELLNRFEIPKKDWGALHFQAIDKILFQGRGSHLDLPYKMTADRKDNLLILSLRNEVLSVKRKKKKGGG